MELGNLMFGNSRGNYSVSREDWQKPFVGFLDRNCFDEYGYKEASNKDFFENDVFSIRPYYWGDDETIAALPNFVYKPTGFELSWYKYPLRDSYCSHKIDDETFFKMLKNCQRSLC